MTTIDRSILRQLTVVALFSGVTMLLILAFVKASGLLLLFASTAVSWGTLGELLLFSLPDLAGLLVPLLTFGTVLWVYARMADDRELVVMSGAGASPWRLGRPALFFAAVMTLVGWTLMLWLVPLSYGAFKDREYEIRSGLASALLEPGRFNPIGGELAVYFRDGDPATTLEGIIIYDIRLPEVRRTIIAESGRLVRDKGGMTFLMENGYVQEREARRTLPRIVGFETFGLSADAESLGFSQRHGRGINERPIDELLFEEPIPEEQHLKSVFRAHGHHQLAQPLLSLALAGAALWLVVAAPPGRRGAPWWRWPAALAVGAGSQWLLVAAASFAERDNALLPGIWIAVLLPGAAAWWLAMKGWRARRGRSGPPGTAAPALAPERA